MKNFKKLTDSFGLNEFGLPDFPKKISNVKISRICFTDERGGCSFCFPHGVETTNSTYDNIQKNWKSYRKHQYKNGKQVEWSKRHKRWNITNLNFDKRVLKI